MLCDWCAASGLRAFEGRKGAAGSDDASGLLPARKVRSAPALSVQHGGETGGRWIRTGEVLEQRIAHRRAVPELGLPRLSQ